MVKRKKEHTTVYTNVYSEVSVEDHYKQKKKELLSSYKNYVTELAELNKKDMFDAYKVIPRHLLLDYKDVC